MRANHAEQFWAKVQKSDGCWMWGDDTRQDGYGRFQLNGRKHLAHRLAYAWARGEIPADAEIDHMCFNRGCVNPDHLRAVTKPLNAQNRASANSNSKSGVRGVYRVRDKWRAVATLNRVPCQIGYFDNVDDAHIAISEWRRKNMPYSETDKKKEVA